MNEHDPLRERWIDLVLSRAGELRDAGVLSLAIDGCSVTLAAKEPVLPTLPEIAKPDATARDDGPLNPLVDPASYPFGIVPGFTIQKLEIED